VALFLIQDSFLFRQFPQLAKAKSSPVKKKKSKNWLASFKVSLLLLQNSIRYFSLIQDVFNELLP
jgi:hypothetical protein